MQRVKKNKCCQLSTGEIIVVENIAYCSNKNGHVILGRQFLDKQDLYLAPCSSSLLGIYRYSVNKLSMLNIWDIDRIAQKMFLYKIPNCDSFAVFPLIHTDQYETQNFH